MSDLTKQLFGLFEQCPTRENTMRDVTTNLRMAGGYFQPDKVISRHVGVSLASYGDDVTRSMLTQDEQDFLYRIGEKIKAGFEMIQSPHRPMRALTTQLKNRGLM